ncbi:FHA domain-containing protein [Clostridium thermarum]|uniref:FHA domain-containing protein n=1 Tax=Clostridium thermarum TaxID=1716543 RepID=UPI00112324C2|nr:FHA domain-containing protein [Clostridium thermarum]
MSDFISFIKDNILITAVAGVVILLLIIILIVAIKSSGKKKVMDNMYQQKQFADVKPNLNGTPDNFKTETLNADFRNVQPQPRQTENNGHVVNIQNTAVNKIQRNIIPEVLLMTENEKTVMLNSNAAEKTVSAETELLSKDIQVTNSNLCETQLLNVEEPGPKARLKYVKNGVETEYVIKEDVVNIGRDPQLCEFVLEENPVGRKHAMLYSKKDRFFLVDLNSKNGTFINGQKVVGEKEIFNNDVVKFAASEVTFLFD